MKTGNSKQVMLRGPWACIVLFIVTAVCLNPLFAKKITVEARGYTEQGAERNALRHAVEQAVAQQLQEEGLIKNKDKIDAGILNNAKGYVKNHFIISTEMEFGMIKVKVAAEVEMGKLESDLVAQQLLYEAKNKPRIMIILEERAAGEEMFEKTATHKFEEFLLEKGFKIVEPEQLNKVQEMEKAKALNDADLASLAFRAGADLIIRGGVNAAKPTPKTIYGKQFYTVPVQLNAHIVRADNAEIIASKTKRVKKNSQEEFSAAQFGLEVGGMALAEELFKSLNEYWRSEVYSQGSMELIVGGLDNSGVTKLEGMLKKVDFIKGVQMRYMEGKSSLFDIQLKGSVQDLRELLDKKKEFGLAVTGVTSNRLTAKAGKGTGEVSFELAVPGLDITSFTLKEIFPSRVRHYENNPLAGIKLKCLSDVPVSDIMLSVVIPGLMDLPADKKLENLGPGEEVNVDVNLILNTDKVLDNLETKTLTGKVTLTYIQNGKREKRNLTGPVKVYDRNTMDWVDPMSLAGFVTYREPSIHKFARQAVVAVGDKEGQNVELLNAAAIFEALRKLGIKYVKDPSASPGNRVLDRVQYPRETIESLSGDCDDTSVLLSALYTAVGIETAVISYPDHVLVMFNTGVFEKNRYALNADPNRVIPHKGTLWVPVETTLINKGFLTAWSTAAQEFHQAVSDGQRVSVVELKEAWETYAAVSIKNKESKWEVPDLKKEVEAAQKQLKEDAAMSWKNAIGAIENKKDITAADKNSLGILYARSGDYKKAESIFKQLMDKHKSPEVINNYACAIMLTGDEKKALKILEGAMAGNKLTGIAINRALSLYLRSQSDNDVESFVTALKEANELLPEGQNLGKYLGFSVAEAGETRAAGDHEKAQKQKVDKRRLKELIRQRVLAKDLSKAKAAQKKGKSGVMPYGGIRGADPEQVAEIVDLLYWYEKI